MDWTTLSTLGIPLLVAIGGVILLWVGRWPQLGLLFLASSLVAGQLLRLPLPGQGGGLLLSDIAVVIILGQAVWLPRQQVQSPLSSVACHIFLLTMPFSCWSLLNLLINTNNLTNSQFLVAFSYWVRLISQLWLLPALLVLSSKPSVVSVLKNSFLITILLLGVGGFSQLLVLPQLQVLGSGWDPHEYRLVSTWLDPNFIGGFLGLVIPWLIATSLLMRTPKMRLVYVIAVVMSVVALGLTRSRGSLLAISLSWSLVSPLIVVRLSRRWRQPMTWISGSVLVVLLLVLAISLLGQRAVGLLTHDPTINLRVVAFVQMWPLATQHVWLGVGYNAYQFVAQQAGVISDFTIHSRAGADNSLLTLWITTGVPGVILFLLPWWYVAWWLWHHRRQSPTLLPLAWLISWLTWFIHAQFVNSLLYSHLLITMAIMTTLVINRCCCSELAALNPPTLLASDRS